MGATTSWFEVDRAGLAAIARRRGIGFVIAEPIQNSWDENTTHVELTLEPVVGRALANLRVQDDSPEGFADLTDSFTMFRESRKLDNPEQRGRFMAGEKFLLAIADDAVIMSTTGSVHFNKQGRSRSRVRTEAGTVLTARLRMTRQEIEEALAIAMTLIPPDGIITTINGVVLPSRTPLAVIVTTLPTEIRGEDGSFRPTQRQTMVHTYEVLAGETPHLYEMGIPVDKIQTPWHLDVGQKIPLALDRGSVTASFIKKVQSAAMEVMADGITEEQARGGWVGTAIETMTNPQAIRDVVRARYGDAVVYDPSAPESNKLAIDADYRVIFGGAFSKKAWVSIRAAEALKPAGQCFSDGKVKTGPDGIPPVPRGEWTDGMIRLAGYARMFAREVAEVDAEIVMYSDPDLGFGAFCGTGTIAFNFVGRLKKAVLQRNVEPVDELLIHECAHFKVSDHLTHAFHQECCRLGARLRSFRGQL